MWETRPVELVLDLPHDIACTVEEVSHRDPDYLRRIIRYGIARRAVYQSLERRLEMSDASAEGADAPLLSAATPHASDAAPPSAGGQSGQRPEVPNGESHD